MNRRLVGVGLAMLMAAGCSRTFTPETVAGIWVLRKVNGTNPPFEFAEGSVTVRITSGFVNLQEDQTFAFTLEVVLNDGMSLTEETREDVGTYVLTEPDVITFTSTIDASVFTATLAGANITTLPMSGISSFSYSKSHLRKTSAPVLCVRMSSCPLSSSLDKCSSFRRVSVTS